MIEITDESFAYVTLKGHPEAGRIRFSANRIDDSTLRFCIMSWARSKDVLVDLTYDKLGIAKALQATTWRTFLERVVELAQGELLGDPIVSECVLQE